MKLTKQEIELIVGVLEKHLEEVKKDEQFAGQSASEYFGEVAYEEFIEQTIAKLYKGVK